MKKIKEDERDEVTITDSRVYELWQVRRKANYILFKVSRKYTKCQKRPATGLFAAQFILLPVHVTVLLTKCCVMHTCDKLVT